MPNNTPARVLVMAAGTGGHIYPALAVARALMSAGAEVHWLASPQGMEHQIVNQENIKIWSVAMKGVRGKKILNWLTAPLMLARAFLQARSIVKQIQPRVVIGFGGYVTVPGGIAARSLNIPLLLQEQNAVAGSANRLLARIAQSVFEGFPNTFANTVVDTKFTGNPVRGDILAVASTDTTASALNILVLGGSLGSLPLNNMLPIIFSQLSDRVVLNIFHQCGVKHCAITENNYQKFALNAEISAYVEDMAERYSWADVVVCRAGALTVAEIAAAGLPAIFIPLPHAIDDHQTKNAQYMVSKGAAVSIAQKDLDSAETITRFHEIFSDRRQLQTMARQSASAMPRNATQILTQCCMEYCA